MFLLVFILFSVVFYFYATKNHNYWAQRKVKHDTPIPFFGNHLQNHVGLKSITEIAMHLYNKYPEEKVVGYYKGSTPGLIIRDLDIAKRILTQDFPDFYLRGLGRYPDVEPIFLNLFHADGDTWKLLRQRLTPAFTTSKLRVMFPMIVQCAEKLQGLSEELISRGGECDARELMARYTTECIGACGFGIQMDTINNENSLFRKLGKQITTRTLSNIILCILWEKIPLLRKFLNAGSHKIEKGITDLLQIVRKQRNYQPSGRNDFIDLLLELEAKGKIIGESIEKKNADGAPITVEMETDLKFMIGQVFVFFAAGFETSSTATSCTLHQLAYNPKSQRKVQEEIDRVLIKYDNKLNYDAIAEMSFLCMAFKEAMRLFPSVGVLTRVSARKHTIPELNMTIDHGVQIWVPIQALHMDKNYFDNPSEFRPERFEVMNEQQKNAYMPFGVGPRKCVGLRLGEMQSLAGLAAVLQKFNVEPAASSRRSIELDHTMNIVQSIKNGLPLKLQLRKFKNL